METITERGERVFVLKGKYILIAHEKGSKSKRYVLANEDGGVITCRGEEALDEYFRKPGRLTSFNTLKENLERRGGILEKDKILAPGDAEGYVSGRIREIITQALRIVGYPRTEIEKIDFFSVPRKTVASICGVPEERISSRL